MVKIKPVVHKMTTDRLVKVTWPILEGSIKDIRSNILGVLDIIRSQLDNTSVTIFHIKIGRKELEGLIIKYGVHKVTLNYAKDLDRDSIQIIFQVPTE